MKKDKKTEQINLRVTKEEKERIKFLSNKSKNNSLSDYIISRSLNLETDESSYFGKINTLTINPWILCELNVNKIEEVTFYEDKNLNFTIKGPGINASKIIKMFNIPTLAMHYSGKFTGEYLKNHLISMGIEQLQFDSKKHAKISLEINDKENKKLNVKGNLIKISNEAKHLIITKIKSLQRDEILMLMGDYHKDDDSFILDLSKAAQSSNVKIIYDLNNNFQTDLLQFNPLVLKIKYKDLKHLYPSLIEEDKLLREENFDYLKSILVEIKSKGPQNVIVTFGQKGSIFLDDSENFYFATLNITFNNSYKSSGDVFLGAFISNYLVNSYEAFLYANAAGLAMSKKRAFPNIDEINEMKKNVKIKKHI